MTWTIPPSAPFSDEAVAALSRVIGPATPVQRAWLAGFLCGVDAASDASIEKPLVRATEPLLIVFATESGNSERLAAEAARAAKRSGFKPTVADIADFDLASLARAKRVIVIAATWGEGDPPSRAVAGIEALMSDATPRLDGVEFGVLALGDRAYVNFCAVGRALDDRLAALGGRRAIDRIDCDLDYAEPAARWIAAAIAAFRPPQPAVVTAGFGTSGESDDLDAVPAILDAEITGRINLNSSRSDKQTWHLALQFDDGTPPFEPGDALDLFVENDPATVDEVFAAVGLSADDDLRRHFVAERDVTTLSEHVLGLFAAHNPEARALLDGGKAREWIADRQLIDLLAAFPARLAAADLEALTRPLAPRAYSIASSRREEEDEIHLLVAKVAWESHGRRRSGVASGHVAERLGPGAQVRARLRPNRHFRLPDPAADAIMIGAGTGVAPFRAFVQERRATAAAGRNWLIFGDRRFTHDFLYQTEWQEALKDGVLSRIDLAFSRDQPEKIYVQHRIRQHRREVVDWLENGARLYVCGDAAAMAKDVRKALVEAYADVRNLSPEAAEQAVRILEKDRRYLQDVY